MEVLQTSFKIATSNLRSGSRLRVVRLVTSPSLVSTKFSPVWVVMPTQMPVLQAIANLFTCWSITSTVSPKMNNSLLNSRPFTSS